MKSNIIIKGERFVRMIYKMGDKKVVKTPKIYGELIIPGQKYLEVEYTNDCKYELVNKSLINA